MRQASVKRCKICSKPYEGFGHNADPVAQGRCCGDCNATKVIPTRFANMAGVRTQEQKEKAV